MPLTFTTPIQTTTAASGAVLLHTRIDVENGEVVHVYAQLDASGVPIPAAVPLTIAQTPAAFQAAFVGATGGIKARLYAAFQAALGAGAAGAVT